MLEQITARFLDDEVLELCPAPGGGTGDRAGPGPGAQRAAAPGAGHGAHVAAAAAPVA